MKIRKKIKWFLLGTLGLAILLFLTLFIHIAVMVYHKGPLPFEHIQMARADFLAPLDKANVAQIKSRLEGQKGVKSTFFSPKDRDVVYTFDNRQNNAANIYHAAIQGAAVPSKPYVVTAADLATGCPAMDNSSFYGKLTAAVSRIVN